MSLVSAVITTHNRRDLLEHAIDSVLRQTYPNIECIVVNDASTDDTDEYCRSRQDIIYIPISKEDSKGGNYARNLGIKAAKGEYVAFLDDDDEWLPEKIEKQVLLMEEKHCECVYCLRWHVRYEKGKEIGRYKESDFRKIEGDCHSKVFRHSFTNTSCIMASKRILLNVGCFDEDLIKLQEFELLVRIAQFTPIYYVHGEPLVCFRNDASDDNRISRGFYRLPIARRFIEKKHASLLRTIALSDRLLYLDWKWTSYYLMASKESLYKEILRYGPYSFFSKAAWKIYRKINND